MPLRRRILKAVPRPLKLGIASALVKTKDIAERTALWHRFSQSIAQGGQDVWVYGEVFNERRHGYFVDIGAHDGVRLSNTYLLERRYKWSGICIEANPASFERLGRNRRATCVHACLDSTERQVTFATRGVMGGIVSATTDNRTADGRETVQLQTRTLESVLLEHGAPKEIDYLSIDVEGAEERVLGGFDFDAYRFTCMTIERPSEPLRELLRRHGYRIVKEFPWLDCFYVHESHWPAYEKNMMDFYSKGFFRIRWW